MNISVIVPVYNVEPYIERCLRSIMKQTFTKEVECILVNDCTPDNSIKIAEKLINEYTGDIQFRIVSHKQNRGIAAVRNTGITEAKGNYTIQIDSDDYIDPDMLEKLYTEAISCNADIVMCDFNYTYLDREIVINESFSDKSSYLREMIKGKHCSLCNKLIKRTLYTQYSIKWIEGFDRGEDYMSCLLLVHYAERIRHIPYALYHYVKYNSSSICHTLSAKVKNNYIDMIYFSYNFIEKYYSKQYLYEWAHMALSIKYLLLCNAQKEEVKKYQSLFPEANPFLKGFLNEKGIKYRLVLQHFKFYKFLKSAKQFCK